MGKISTYGTVSAPTLSDKLIGTYVEDMNLTKNFRIGDLFNLAAEGSLVPYTGATQNVDLGNYGIIAAYFIKAGGLSSQFLKADGSVDSNVYLTEDTASTTYVPYTGATNDVVLGTQSLYANNLYAEGSIHLSAGPFYVGDDDPGANGQVLYSQGSLLPPKWGNLPAHNYGSFYDTTTQTVTSGGIAAIKYNTAVISSGVTIVNNPSGQPTRITFANAGTYNIQFSAQLNRATGGSSKQVSIWLRKNGTDVPYSNTHLTVQANASYLVAAWNFMETVAANQFIEIMWSQNDAINIVAEPADTVLPHPATPSVILTVDKVS